MQDCAGWEKGSDQPCDTLQSHPKAAKNHLEGQCKQQNHTGVTSAGRRLPKAPKHMYKGELLLF